MLLRYFRSMLRNFKSSRSTFLINIIGLSTGMACAIVIMLWVQDEFTFDKFHDKDSRIFQVMTNYPNNNTIQSSEGTPGPLAEALAQELPEVEFATTLSGANGEVFTLSVENNFIKASGDLVAKDYFNIFSYGLIAGDPATVIADPKSIAISDELAMKLFNGTNEAMGKTVEFQRSMSFVVTGVFKKVPLNSTHQFDFVLSFELLKMMNPGTMEWGNTGPETYVLLKEGANPEEFNKKIENFVKLKKADSRLSLFARPYSDRYLYGSYNNGQQAGGRIEYVKLFSVIGVFVILIACINFMNLSTANASRRLKEVGVRKAIGASRAHLVAQYMSESFYVTVIASIIAVVIVVMLLPTFNQVTGKHLALGFDTTIITGFVCILLFTAFASGSYPALFLSGFNPAAIFKGKTSTATGGAWLRKGLVVFQFSVSVILIVGVIVVYRQIEFVQTENLGYNDDNVIYFSREGKTSGDVEPFINEVKTIPGVVDASITSFDMVGHQSAYSNVQWEGKDPEEEVVFEAVNVGHNVIDMLGMTMAIGRAFSRDFSTDDSGIIFNETAIKRMGLEDALGKTVKWGDKDYRIIGVVKDFHFESFHESVKPLLIVLDPKQTNYVIVKIEAGEERETIARLKQFYLQYNPGFNLDYRFLNEEFQAQYESERQIASLSTYFSGVAIIISCLGLFGLVAFTAQRRLKEICIRKVHGSSELNIIYILSVDFTKLILVALIISLPASYFILQQWLERFVFRIDLELWFFVGAGVMAFVIMWLAIGVQIIKVARVNPTKYLASE